MTIGSDDAAGSVPLVRGMPLPAGLVRLIDSRRWQHPGDDVLQRVIPWLTDPLDFLENGPDGRRVPLPGHVRQRREARQDLPHDSGWRLPLVFAPGDVMGAIDHLFASTDNRRAGQDTEAFLAYLAGREDVVGTQVGTTGYCMGGAISLTVAGTYREQIAAAAGFHGGNLAKCGTSQAIQYPKRSAASVCAGTGAHAPGPAMSGRNAVESIRCYG